MKFKQIKKPLIAVIIIAMVSLTGCGGIDESNDNNQSEVNEATNVTDASMPTTPVESEVNIDNTNQEVNNGNEIINENPNAVTVNNFFEIYDNPSFANENDNTVIVDDDTNQVTNSENETITNNTNIELEEEEENTEKVYTTDELIGMNLNEIINLMGGNFDISAFWGQVRISNYDVFPRMSFGTSYRISDNAHYGKITESEIEDFKEQVANGSCTLTSITLNNDTSVNEEFGDNIFTAEELSKKTLDEIIDLMGDDFKVGCDGGDPTRGTSPEAVYIYNYNTLPDFKFYIPDANEDNMNGQDVKHNIKSDKYDGYEYIRLSDDAKLTNKISANMTYNELANVIGEFDCIGAAASGSYSYSTDTVGDITRYIFPPNDSLINSGINEVKRDWLKNNNPTLSNIIVYPEQ